MRPGKVATIRVNPTTCLGVLDICRKIGIDMEGMSFPQLTSVALSSLVESARQAGLIPERDGFEYSSMMEPYLIDERHKRKEKLARANQISLASSDLKAPVLMGKKDSQLMLTRKPAQIYPPETRSVAAGATEGVSTSNAATRLTYLLQKKDMADMGKIEWTDANQREYDECFKIVYPDG